jgi:hypothetical protein
VVKVVPGEVPRAVIAPRGTSVQFAMAARTDLLRIRIVRFVESLVTGIFHIGGGGG